MSQQCLYQGADCANEAQPDSKWCGKHQRRGKYEEDVAAGIKRCANKARCEAVLPAVIMSTFCRLCCRHFVYNLIIIEATCCFFLQPKKHKIE